MNNKKFNELVNNNNKKMLIKTLLTEQGTSRVEIAKKLGVSTASVSKMSEALINHNIIEEVGSIDDGKIGRKQIKLKIKKDQFYISGVEVHSNYINVIVSDLSLKILYENSFKFEILKQEHINLLIDDLMYIKEKFDHKKNLGMGLLIQGIIKNNESISLPISDIFNQIKSSVGIEPKLLNNIKGLAVTENFAQSSDLNYLFVRYGPGIGGVISINGKVQNGLRNRAGEIGHIRWDFESDLQCPICKQYGCLESVINLNRIYRERYGGFINSHSQINEKFINDNLDTLITYVKTLAKAISQSVDLIDPDYVLLAGRLFDEDKIFNCLVEEINNCKEIDYTNRIKKIADYNKKVKYAPIIIVLDEYLK